MSVKYIFDAKWDELCVQAVQWFWITTITAGFKH